MSREEILEQIEELEGLLYEIDEEDEELDKFRKQATKGAKTINILIEEFDKAGIPKDLAIEIIKYVVKENI